VDINHRTSTVRVDHHTSANILSTVLEAKPPCFSTLLTAF
jgi:hypothetical protein